MTPPARRAQPTLTTPSVRSSARGPAPPCAASGVSPCALKVLDFAIFRNGVNQNGSAALLPSPRHTTFQGYARKPRSAISPPVRFQAPDRPGGYSATRRNACPGAAPSPGAPAVVRCDRGGTLPCARRQARLRCCAAKAPAFCSPATRPPWRPSRRNGQAATLAPIGNAARADGASPLSHRSAAWECGPLVHHPPSALNDSLVRRATR